MAKISIDRLEIHLKGISRELARDFVAGLGNELLGQLATQNSLLTERRTTKISKIDIGTIKAERSLGSSKLRRMIANRITESIASRKPYGNPREEGSWS